MAIWLTTSWSLKTRKPLGVETTLMRILRVCVWGDYIYTLEPMLDCCIVPIKHIFDATQKSRSGTTKARRDAAFVPELLRISFQRTQRFTRNAKPHKVLLTSRLELFAGSFQQCGLSVSVSRDLQKNEISWTIEDMNGPFSALEQLKRL